jgi:SAM-dependent methyltransferase
MDTYETVRKEYNTQAVLYNDLPQLPYGKLESQVFGCALGDATGQTILDLGGGTGLKARQALDAGAASVDVVDISAEMMNVGEAIENKLGRQKIRWFEADVAKPLDHLQLGLYDIVMVNWLFDHAESEEALEGMWKNVATHLKPGGRFVGVRSADPRSPALATKKYGMWYQDIEDIPGGVKLRYAAALDPPIEFEATMMEASYGGSTKLHEKYGLENIEYVSFTDVPCIQEDPEYWKLFLDDPSLAGVKARKKLE